MRRGRDANSTAPDFGGARCDTAREWLQRSGHQANDFTSAMAQDPSFATAMGLFGQRFDAAASDMASKMPRPVETPSAFQLTSLYAPLGPPSIAAAEKSGADAVLLLRYVGYQKSTSRLATEAALISLALAFGSSMGTGGPTGGIIEAALVDGRTGGLLWIDAQVGEVAEDIALTAMDTLPQDIDPPQSSQHLAAWSGGSLVNADSSEATRQQERHIIELLASSRPADVTSGARQVYAEQGPSPSMLDASYRSLLQHSKQTDTSTAWAEAIEQLMRVLARSGNKHYYTALEHIAATTTNQQLARSARRFANQLLAPVDPNASCDYPIDSRIPCEFR